ncbi:MAG TPA: DNA primase [Rudaea sp.]|jgi:DNA primase|uniref:DNA primase n=1 Tax=Rudaea sp. TaxID=2136325 RepID=UPI002F92D14A
MSGRIPDQFIDELLARIDIVDVIEQRVPLRKAGRDWSARCPFHDERSPSFTVSPAKQFYHCFGCGAHGSAIKFLMDYDRMEFVDAVEDLAARAGLKVPYEGGGKRTPAEDSTDLYTVLDAAAKFYQRELGKNENARAYFDGRGLDAQTVERFGLGYAPDQWDALKSALGTNEKRIALLEKSGMLTSGERGKYDRFRDRVMFPIQDRRGRTIAFGGRIIEKSGDGSPVLDSGVQDARKSDGPKYLNSPETPLFHKGQQLFALWQVRQAHSKIPRLIVVEGYMDVIALFQHGVTQAVATLGTATTRDHAELLFRQCADVYFCFDGDRAGRQAAWRAVESVLPRMRDGRQAFFLFLPDGEDPDSLVRKEGQVGFEDRLKVATPLSEFFFGELGKDVNLTSLDGKARLAERARPLIGQIPDGAFRDLMLGELDRVANVKLRIDTPAANAPRRPARPQERTLVRTAVALLLQNPGFVAAIEPPHLFSTLRQPGIPLLSELIALCRERPEISTGAAIEHFGKRDEVRALQKLAVMEFPGGEEQWKSEFLDALTQLDRQTSQQRIDDLMKQRDESVLSDSEKQELGTLLKMMRS